MKESTVVTRVLETSPRLFFEQGYNLTGINQIIEESQISKSSLYVRFPSKGDVLLPYLKQLNTRWFSELENFIGSLKDPAKSCPAYLTTRQSNR